jgi:hypothetical protein
MGTIYVDAGYRAGPTPIVLVDIGQKKPFKINDIAFLGWICIDLCYARILHALAG